MEFAFSVYEKYPSSLRNACVVVTYNLLSCIVAVTLFHAFTSAHCIISHELFVLNHSTPHTVGHNRRSTWLLCEQCQFSEVLPVRQPYQFLSSALLNSAYHNFAFFCRKKKAEKAQTNTHNPTAASARTDEVHPFGFVTYGSETKLTVFPTSATLHLSHKLHLIIWRICN